MTPSINRLASSAQELGTYMMESEWDTIMDDFDRDEQDTVEKFTNWVQGYMYYHALVCACGGNIDEINSQLVEDHNELMLM